MKSATRHYQRILAGAALRYSGYPTVQRALRLAAREGAGLYLLHALDEDPHGAAPTAPSAPHQAGEARYQLERLQAAHPEIREIRMVNDRCWRAIDSAAEELDADLIVIGTHIHNRLRAHLGGTEEEVLHHVPRDLLLVRSERYEEGEPPAEYRHLLLASDLGPESAAAAARAVELASGDGAQVTLLHVVEHFPTDRENDRITPENEDPMAYQQRNRERDLEAFARAHGLADAAIQVVVTEGPAEEVIPATAQELGADLLLLGLGRPTMADRLFGASVDAIVAHAPCDCLLVRSRG